MELVPVKEHLEENSIFANDPDCRDSLAMSIDFYKRIGFTPPWICYYTQLEDQLVGCAAYKGQPVNGKIEIAYGVFPQYWQKGIGTQIAKKPVEVALETDPSLIITARTLPEENFSARILRKNNFQLLGPLIDPKYGEVWEWEYMKDTN